MNTNIDSQINEARELLERGFKMEEVSNRNEFINRGLEKFKAIEKQNITNSQEQKISNIRTTYSKELLKVLRPISLVEDMNTFMCLTKMNKNFKELFDENPQIEKNFNKFISSLKRSSDFRHFLSQIEKES